MAKGKSPGPARNARRINMWNTRAMAAEAAAAHGVRRVGRLTIYRTKDHAKEHGQAGSRRTKRAAEPKPVAVEEKPAQEAPKEAPPKEEAASVERLASRRQS